MVKFSSNPILFKIQYINKEQFDTTTYASGVLGRAFHHAMEVYYGNVEEFKPKDEAQAIEYGLAAGMDFLDKYNIGFISFTAAVDNKQKMFDMFSFAFNHYVQYSEYDREEVLACELEILEPVSVEWRGHKLTLPVPLKGFIDKVVRSDGKLKIKDYKTCSRFSDPEKIDGAKILQAIQYYLLVYAHYGEEPYSITYEEVKLTKNRDGSPQVREYEIVYADNELFFDFYFRFYEDMVRALNGEQVFPPNIHTMFDNEVSIIAYIHRLDVEQTKAELMIKHKVKTISELLRKEIQSAGNMRKLMKTVEQKFISAKNINYDAMSNEEKIQHKMMEHGMMLQFDSVVSGATVDLYRYTPSIGLKMKRLTSYVEDIEQVLGISGVRVLAPIANSTLVGFEVPRSERSYPTVPAGDGFDIAIGQTIMGEPRRFDIRQAPHMLVAGASGSGKSVFLNSLISQLVQIPNTELHLFDPKRVELSQWKGAAKEYESEVIDIYTGLIKLEQEMTKRYKALEKAGAKNISEMPGIPYKFVVIDEFGELIVGDHTITEEVETGEKYSVGAMAGKPKIKKVTTNISEAIERKILRLAQMARAAGIHVIIATQRPSADIIKGTIKANFPTKVVFRTSKAVDSLVVLDDQGAEKLAGKGDMLFASDTGIERLQGYNS